MTKPLTKEQRAEMRERFMLGEYTPEDVQDVFERLEEADLATAKLATARVCERCFDEKNSTYEGIPRFFKNCPNCTNGVVISDERARELLEELDRLRHVEQLYAASESLRKQLNDAAVKDATKFNELLERLKRAEEDSELLDELEEAWLEEEDCPIMLIEESKTFVCTTRSGKHPKGQPLREAICAARAKEGAAE